MEHIDIPGFVFYPCYGMVQLVLTQLGLAGFKPTGAVAHWKTYAIYNV